MAKEVKFYEDIKHKEMNWYVVFCESWPGQLIKVTGASMIIVARKLTITALYS